MQDNTERPSARSARKGSPAATSSVHSCNVTYCDDLVDRHWGIGNILPCNKYIVTL